MTSTTLGENLSLEQPAIVKSNKFPRQIRYIIGNELCERFSYYGMKAILVIFMTKHLMIADNEASMVYHFFTAGCYLLPLFGAFISDRFLGRYRTILYLSLFYCLGHASLAIWENKFGLYLGLSLIAFGSGGIKPCVSAFVGDQFQEENKHLVEKVFDIFYFSINFGAFFSTILTPVFLKYYGPSVAFGIPGILMGIATIIFFLGRKYYIKLDNCRVPGKESAGFFQVVLFALLNQKDKIQGNNWLSVAHKRYSDEEVEAVESAVGIFKIFSLISVFWALFDQSSSTWTLQAEKMDRMVFGMQLEAAQIGALNPIMVMLLIPLFAYVIYPTIEKMGFRLSALRKMSMGMVLAGLSFVMVGLIQFALDAGQSVNVSWQFLPYLVLTCSEVMISITGLEFAYSQAHPSMKSTIMSLWLLTVFVGNMITAEILHLNPFSGGNFFLFFAFLMFVVSIGFIFLARGFKSHSFYQHQK